MNSKYFHALLCLFFTLQIEAQTLTIRFKTDIIDEKDAYGITGFTSSKLVLDKNQSLYYSSNRDTIYEDPMFGRIVQKAAPETENPDYKDLVKKESYSTTFFDDYVLKDVGYAPG